jgi:ABC-2 type transport system ATP-binding protein
VQTASDPRPPRSSAPATSTGDGRIVARGLSRRFGAKVALEPIDLDVGPSGITGLLGPNGSGKSTLLRCLLGIVRPDAGTASIDGVALDRDGVHVRRRCAYSPGEIGLYGELTGRAHLEWFLRGRGRAAEARALEIARELALPLDRRVRAYSHGMKRQLLFAAALAPDVRVRILDEATEGLDPSKRGAVLELLQADAARGTTILLSSHHLGEVDRVCDRLIFLNEGKKLADETAASVAARAQRCVRFTFPADADIGRVAAELARIDRARLVVEGERIDVHLEADDARPFIAAVCTSTVIPRPRSIEFGALSLAQMYRELYGVDGC